MRKVRYAVDGTRMDDPISKEEMEAEIAEFYANGGKITTCTMDDGEYDRSLKRNTKRLGGAVNPFSKSDALSVD